KVDSETKKEVVKNVKAMFMHKIGGTLVNTADSLIISAFIGVVVLGKYSNYTTIMIAMTGIITLFFTPLTSIFGHLYAGENGESLKKYYHFFHTFNFILGTVFFLGYYGIIDNLVTICFDAERTGSLEMAKSVSFVLTLDYFIQFMRQATSLFRDATGTFYNDRWKPFIEGAVNVALSIGFVLLFSRLFGEEMAVVGVIAATILTNLLICHVVEPHVLYKYALHERATKFYIKNYLYIATFTVALIALHFCMVTTDNEFTELLANGFISVGIAVVPCLIALLSDRDFREYIGKILKKIKRRMRKTES
ncbi:MAG: lipopolysaccharide biosynthesis protein, partial [Candidatus Gallimonas sp.]